VFEPGRKQGGLAKAGRGGDERERAVEAEVEVVRQAGTRHQISADRWDGEFRD
jgi:hypothetical protein